MRVDDWNEDTGEEPREEWAPAPEPRPAAEAPAANTPTAEAAPAPPYTRPSLRVMWPIYLVGGLTMGTICIMFLIVMALIATR